MDHQIKMVFLLLILFQGFHSIEEYFGRLWEVLTPARIVSAAVSSNLGIGFMMLNIGIFLAGSLSWFITTRQNQIFYLWLIWVWVIIETINGIGHILFAINQNGYFPGIYTAPFLLVTALYLARLLLAYSKNLSQL